jgi:hypothetical protein
MKITMKYLYKRLVASAMVLFVAPIMASTTFAQDDVIAPTVEVTQPTAPVVVDALVVAPTPTETVALTADAVPAIDATQPVDTVSSSTDLVNTSATDVPAQQPATDVVQPAALIAEPALLQAAVPAPATTGSDLSMIITTSVSTGMVGDHVTYTVTYANTGATATGVVVAVEIP